MQQAVEESPTWNTTHQHPADHKGRCSRKVKALGEGQIPLYAAVGRRVDEAGVKCIQVWDLRFTSKLSPRNVPQRSLPAIQGVIHLVESPLRSGALCSYRGVPRLQMKILKGEMAKHESE